MSRFQSLKSSQKYMLLLLELLLLGSLAWWGAAKYWPVSPAPEVNPLKTAWELSQAVGQYKFKAQATQKLLPRPLPVMIGQGDQSVDMALEGAVTLPDQSRLQISIDGPGLDSTPITIIQNGTESRLLRNGEVIPMENPVSAFSPTGDYLNYLAAADDIAPCNRGEALPKGAETCFTFAVDGARFARHVQERLEAQIAANSGALPPGASINVSPSPVLSQMNGDGRVWLDGNRLPLQMDVNLFTEHATKFYDSQVEMEMAFTFDEEAVASWQQAQIAPFPFFETWRAQLPAVLQKLALLAVTGSLFGMAVIYRKRQWLYGVLAVLVSGSMVLTPLLQATAYAHSGFSQSSNSNTTANTLAKLLTTPADTPTHETIAGDEDTAAAVPAGVPTEPVGEIEAYPEIAVDADIPDNYCGSGSKTIDRDGDDLDDNTENCLGTNVNAADSDFDGIPDGAELSGFDYNDKHWVTDPLNPDSNNDGIEDGKEWQKGNDYGEAPKWDYDGDGVPNLWDYDDDGDGVADSRDLSPFSRTGFVEDFDFQVVDQFDGYIYIDIQIQPQDTDQLRYGSMPLDWPDDSKGQIQDLDKSTDDLRLIPMLEVYTNNTPNADLANKYGASFNQDDKDYFGYTRMLINLNRVGDGNTEAYSARLGYGPDTLKNLGADGIDLRDARLVWMVRGKLDSVKSNSKIEVNDNPIQIYPGSAVRITGWQVSKSKDYHTGLLGTPSMADNDRQLFQLMLGLHDTFLSNPDIDLAEIRTRFTNGSTPTEKKWGVSTNVKVDVPTDPDPHQDQGVANLNNRIRTFLDGSYGGDTYNTIIIATDQKSGLYDQDQLLQVEPSTNVTVGLNKISLITMRSVNLHMRKGLTTLSEREFDKAVMSRIQTSIDDAYDDLVDQYPQINKSDLLAMTQAMYTTWNGGRTRMLQLDELSLVGGQPSTDESVYQQIYLTPKERFTSENIDTLPGYLVEVGQLGQEGRGLLFDGSIGQAWQFLQANSQAASRIGFTAATAMFVKKLSLMIQPQLNNGIKFSNLKLVDNAHYLTSTGFGNLKTRALGFSTIADWVQGTDKVKNLLNNSKALNALKTFSRLKKVAQVFSKALGPALLAVDLALTWTSFGLGSDFSALAIANAIAVSALSVALFAISLAGGPVGAALVTLFVTIDFIVGWAGGPSISGAVMAFFVSGGSTPVTEIGDFNFESGYKGVVDADKGYVAGNRFYIADTFKGTITGNTKDYEVYMITDDVEKSEIYGRYELVTPYNGDDYEASVQNNAPDCTRNGTTQTCTNYAGVEYLFKRAKRDMEFKFKSLIRARTYKVDCTHILVYVDCETNSQSYKFPEKLDKKDRWDDANFYIDVLPATIKEVWEWSELNNPDPDGDGLKTSEELKLGTSKDKWDTDGDGLSDYFEYINRGALGTDPLKKDTDGDYLTDRQEYRLGTAINKRDSDGDGLWDWREVFFLYDNNSSWYGGWSIQLNGKSYRVFSDPNRKDTDGDGMSDLTEIYNNTSPTGYNVFGKLSLDSPQFQVDPAGRTAVYAKPEDAINLTAKLSVYRSYTVATTLSMELPSDILNTKTVGDMTGDRSPATGGTSSKPEWSFAAPKDTLQSREKVQVTVSTKVKPEGQLTLPISGSVTLKLPHPNVNLEVAAPIIIDADDPLFGITSPTDGTIIGGGTSSLVLGGFSDDPTSWIHHIDLTLPGSGVTTINQKDGTSPWAATWTLPGDGIHTLSGTAYDFANNSSPQDSVEVMVDNSSPAATIDLTEGYAYGPAESGDVISITVQGTASDSWSGLARVMVSLDNGPWQDVWTLEDAHSGNTTYTPRSSNFQDSPTGATWDLLWKLPNIDSVQGYHSVRAMAIDQAGNPPTIEERNIIVDVTPPSDELTNRAYLHYYPHIPAGTAHTFRGVANDAGNVPHPSRPVDLSGSLDSIDDATIQLGLSSIDDSVDGVHATWIGDFNGDRRDDLLIGLPAAADGKGRISIVYGRSGDWPVPDEREMLANSPTSFVGVDGAGLGDVAVPAGDVNGDGLADILIGDVANNRVFIVFGQYFDIGVDLELSAAKTAHWWVLTPPAGEQIGTYLGAAGDVNGDGFDDVLVGIHSGGSKSYLLLGSKVPINEALPLDSTTIEISGAGAATLATIGDASGDFYDEFAIGSGGTLYIFGGKSDYSIGQSLGLSDAVATFGSADSSPQVAALGDINGDNRDDFIYSNGGSQQVVYGNDSLSGWNTHNFSYGSGFVAGPGDVNRDGLNDILIGGNGNAYLVLGSNGSLGGEVATISGVAGAGSVATSHKADLNSDGSSDLLLLPNVPDGQAQGSVSGSDLPELPPAWLPAIVKQTALDQVTTDNFTAVPDADAYVSTIVNNCYSLTPCYSSIQGAVDARSNGDLIIVQPGVYPPFTIDGKDNMTVRGMNTEAVFVDGAGGSFAAKVANATGVRLEQMTFQNATAGVLLDEAGSYAAPGDKVVLDTVLARNVTGNAVSMSRTSALSVIDSTLVAANNHINVTGSFDPAFAPSWETLPNTPWAPSIGSSLVAVGNKLYANPGDYSDSFQAFVTASDSWQATITNTAVPMFPESVMAGGSDGQVYALGAPYWGPDTGAVDFASTTGVQEVTINPANGYIYAEGEWDDVHEWDGSSWTELTDGTNLSSIRDLAVNPATGHVYAAQYTYGPDGLEYWNGTNWVGIGYSRTGDVEFKTYTDYAHLYAKVEDVEVLNYSHDTSSWYNEFNPDDGGYVNDIEIDQVRWVNYYGGSFSSPGTNIVAGGSALGNTLAGEVRAIAVDQNTGDVWACGDFQAPGIARWDWVGYDYTNGAWTFLPPVFASDAKLGTENNCYDIQFAGGRIYAKGDWQSNSGNEINLVRWNGTGWDVLAKDDIANHTDLDGGGGQLLISGNFWRIGVPDHYYQTEKLARLLPAHHVYNPTTDSWSEAAWPPITPGKGASYAGTAAGFMTYIPGGGSKITYRYNITDDTWAEAGVLTDSVLVSAMTQGENGDVYAVVDSGGFYRHTGSAWVPAGDPISSGLATIDAGVSMTYNSDTGTYYVLPGGGSTKLLRNTGTGWEAAPAELDTAEGIKLGSELAYISTGVGKGVYAFPGNDAGGTSQAFWRLSYPPQPTKLELDNVAFVSPSAGTWTNLPDPLPGDFGVSGLDTSQWFGGTDWAPTNGITLTETSTDPFVDQSAGIYRMGQSGYDVGYHTYRDEVTVAADGSGDFTSIQAALNSGTYRVKIEPGVYEERLYLPSGVEVLGSNADWTIIRNPGPGSTLVQASGVVQSSLSLVTLDGNNATSDYALKLTDGADIELTRSIAHSFYSSAIWAEDAGTNIEMANTTVALNNNGVYASGCASIDMRNTIVAYNSNVGLNYDTCAPTKNHNYNLFWENRGGHFGADASTGAGELFIDPNFVDPTGGDYRTLNFSPVIDAGNPTDPAPPGEGNRIDIGYVEQGRANFYVDAAYCELCENDGLTWQVDAFDTIQAALDDAANTVARLRAAPEDVPTMLVAVAPGTYYEAVSVPSHVLLVGSGAENTILDAGSLGSAVTFNGVTAAGVRDFTLTGAGSVGVIIKGAANDIAVHHNIIRGTVAGLMLSDRGTGLAEFNTIVNNTVGATASGSGSWLEAENNIFSGNGTGLSAAGSSQIFSNYNLLNNSTNTSGVTPGDTDVVGQNPAFAGGGTPYRLTVGSPARDMASPRADVPAGGGALADMGYSELLAAPISLILGKEDLSTAMGNSGVDKVEVGLVPVADDSQPYTATVPSTWTPVSVDSRGETVSYWNTNLIPPVEGMYRFYSRATDMVGNTETDETNWYAGSIVADNTPPAVTWLSPGSNPGVAPVELRAQVSDYLAGQFNVEEKDVYFDIDGDIYPATWTAEPWDEAGGQPRVFRAWVSLPVGFYSSVRAYAEDKAGNSATASGPSFSVSTIAPVDSTPPAVTVAQPTDGGYVTSTVTFKGTTSDGGSGVAAVEVSVDGGATWLPAALSGNNWELTWAGPEGLPFVSFPARARATDKTGNQNSTSFTFTIDEVAPTGLTPVTFNVPEGSHVDSVTNLAITWNQPVDGSGSVTTLLAADLISDTTPVDAVTGTSANRSLNASGDWYVHLAAQDAIGNKTIHHYGPWHVGLNEGVAFGSKQQSIVVDGYLDVDHGEWQLDEFLDNDERNIGANVTYSPGGQQSFYTTWSGNQFYMAWQGGWWELDGTLWVYLDTSGGGSSQLISTVAGATLPFDADYAVEITSPSEGRLWRNSGGWQQASENWDFAQGDNGDTEIRLPLNGATSAETLAFAQGDDGNVWAIFPATNPLMPGAAEAAALTIPLPGKAGALVQAHAQATTSWGAYSWPSLPAASEDPSAGQPKAINAELTLASLQSVEVAQGPGGTMQYVATIINQETYTLTNQPVAFLAFPGNALVHDSIAGASCSSTAPSWVCTVPSVPPGTTAITLTTHLATDLSSTPEVAMIAVLQNGSIPPEKTIQGMVTHRTDSSPPTVEVNNKPFVGLGQQTIRGISDDGEGIGVDYVEVQPDGGGWQRAQGTAFWSVGMSVPPFAQHGDNWRFYVRAVDFYGHTSEPVPYVFTVDLEGPDVAMDLPLTLAGTFNEILGETNDSPTGSESIVVEAKLDDDIWREAALFDPTDGGEQPFLWTWNMPTEDGITHTVELRAADIVGNIGEVTEPYTVTVDNVPPVLSVTHALTEVVVQNYRPTRLKKGPPVLSGTITDGGRVQSVTVRVELPDGDFYNTDAVVMTNTWQYTPELTAVGTYTLLVEAFDWLSNTARSEKYPLLVKAAPDTSNNPYLTFEDTPLTIEPLSDDLDLDGDVLYISYVGQPLSGTATISGALVLSDTTVLTGPTQLVYTPTLNFNGTDVFTYTASDGVLTGTSTITVTVLPINDAPVITPALTSTIPLSEDTRLDLPLTVIEVDGNPITWTVPLSPAHGLLTLSALTSTTITVAYTPTSQYAGADAFTLQVSDGLLTDTLAVNISVQAVDDPPLAEGDTILVLREGTDYTYVGLSGSGGLNVLENDSDPEGLELTITDVGAASHGGTSGKATDSKSVTYQPASDIFTGTDTFTYTVTDGSLSSSATVTAVVVAGSSGGGNGDTFTTGPTGISNTIAITVDIPAAASAGGEQLALVYTMLTTPTTPANLPPSHKFAGVMFNLDVYVNGVKSSPYTFTTPITLTISYSDTDVADLMMGDKELGLWYWNGEAWRTDGITRVAVYTEENRLVTAIGHATKFALLGRNAWDYYLPIIFGSGDGVNGLGGAGTIYLPIISKGDK